jgi:hypothetical protein
MTGTARRSIKPAMVIGPKFAFDIYQASARAEPLATVALFLCVA